MRGLALLSVIIWIPVSARTVFEPGKDPVLDARMLAHTRVFYAFSARPFGIGLVSEYPDDAALGLVRKFAAQETSLDPQVVTGKHPYLILSRYEGAGGVGLRGGGAAIGTAFRYMALKAEGAPEAVLASARRDVVRALEAVHVAHVITGVPRVMARGIGRLISEDPTDPPIPTAPPDPVPLFDRDGKPLPEPKNNGVDRADNSGGLLPKGMWFWQDSCSKDQLVGWVAAMATLYDAAKDDKDINQVLVQAVQNDACELARGLREKHPFVAADGNTYDYDLIIMDSDGRPTFHHDLHPAIFDATIYLPPDTQNLNVFNLVMALGILKGLHHVCPDADSEAFLYDEVMKKRGWLDALEAGTGSGVDYVYMGVKTNFSNVNMVAIALFLAIYLESEDAVAARIRTYMENRWWNPPGVRQAARWAKQPYFHALYLAMTDRGTDTALALEAASLLKAFRLDPYTNEERINCDETELQKGECLAVDGKTLLVLAKETNRGGWPVATEALDPSIRPPSSFDARSDPFEVNGGGGKSINPGGDLHAAYWLLRFMPERGPGEVLRSPKARPHRPVLDTGTHEAESAQTAEDQGGREMDNGSGCCAGTGATTAYLLPVLLLPCRLRRLGNAALGD